MSRERDVLVVVAAGPGLGRAVATRFAVEGWAVGLLARSEPSVAELADEVRRAGAAAVATATADAGDPDALRAALRTLAGELGDATVLVHNASAYVTGSVLGLSAQDLRKALDVGVTSALAAAQEAAPAMQAAGSGTIVLTGSVAADRASTSAAAVGMAKAALRSLAVSLHQELAPDGVRVVTVTIDGVLSGPHALDLDAIAERYWVLATGADVPDAVETFPPAIPQLRWDAVAIDCRDPHELARFWSALLATEVRGSIGPYVGLAPTGPGLPRLILQRVADPRPVKNSLHLDLHVPSVDVLPAAVDRAVALGASILRRNEDEIGTWVTLADPEGNQFCIVSD